MMSCMESSRPPGVFMVIRTSAAWESLACAMPSSRYSARMGSISPSMLRTTTCGAADAGAGGGAGDAVGAANARSAIRLRAAQSGTATRQCGEDARDVALSRVCDARKPRKRFIERLRDPRSRRAYREVDARARWRDRLLGLDAIDRARRWGDSFRSAI